jgi:hypothetical protein
LLVIMMVVILKYAVEIMSDDVIYVHAKFYKDIFGYASNIFIITSRI